MITFQKNKKLSSKLSFDDEINFTILQIVKIIIDCFLLTHQYGLKIINNDIQFIIKTIKFIKKKQIKKYNF